MFFHFVKYKLDTIKLKTKLFAKHPEKTREKVAEITITHKTAQKYSLFWDLHRAILLTQRETLAAHNCEGTEQLHKIIINSILLLTY